MYNSELVQQICRDINDSTSDIERERELLSLLRAVLKEDQEEVRMRMAFLLKKYGTVIEETSEPIKETSESKAAD